MCICGCRAAVPCVIIKFWQELRDHSPCKCTSREDSQVLVFMSAGMLCNFVPTNLYCRILLTVDPVQSYSADIGDMLSLLTSDCCLLLVANQLSDQ